MLDYLLEDRIRFLFQLEWYFQIGFWDGEIFLFVLRYNWFGCSWIIVFHVAFIFSECFQCFTMLQNEIITLKANNYIWANEYKFLSKHFNSLRIHKCFEKIPPLRPIVSAFHYILANLSEHADPSYNTKLKPANQIIRYTWDFSSKLMYHQLPS